MAICIYSQGFPCSSAGKEPACNAGDLVRSLGWEDPLEKGKAAHSTILAWRIPWTVLFILKYFFLENITEITGLSVNPSLFPP